MNTTGKSALLALSLGFLCSNSDAFGNPEGHRIYRSAGYLGRGDTGIADADDQDAIFYNPAGLAQGKSIYKRMVFASPHFEISSQTRDIYKRIQIDQDDQVDVLKDQIGKPLHVGVNSLTALVFRRAALGAIVSTQANVLVKKDPNYGGLETLEADYFSNQGLTFSLADGFLNNSLMVGATAKYINRGQAGIESNIIDAQKITDMKSDDLIRNGKGMGFDLGLMWQSQPTVRLTQQSFGLTLTDIGDTNFNAESGKSKPDALRQAINAGYVLKIGTKLSQMKVLLDVLDITGNYESNLLKRTHIGSEINVAEYLGLLAGLNQGYPTAGMYFDVRFVRVDLGFYTEERGDRVGMYPDQRYYLRLLMGI